ncbi:MAG: rubrerythrin [Gomphosphaeria aponina SAG 52.96 = DSM 107014]|uniref:Rubrerythrin n=1 Tax=Gomphosphaeria aponina SAG 52.96 = DSM 107014 TaxID=1521640 RepID=A0A941JSH3_9CHRO|nr:rubrerythrin [Gomphosphaeria aponina SAG 52.96 = DSM 107014]
MHNLPKFNNFTKALMLAGVVGVFALVNSPKQTPSFTLEIAAPVQAAETDNEETLKNLQAAYNGEANANALYLAFAEKADEEGYHQVAVLFRAAALAEQIHRDNHGEVIKLLGGTPEATIETPEVKSTSENLEAAIAGESYERDTMYPGFLKQAESVGNMDAVNTFRFAMEAEAEHAKYYTEAKDNLEDWKEAKFPFFVCPRCGYTTTELNFATCPVCGEQKEDFTEVV